jgi:hypothetical protein
MKADAKQSAKKSLEGGLTMQFILTGFTQDMGFRVFAFEGTGEDRIRTKFTVRADLSLIRTYGIRLQELPLMCRGILERRPEGEEARALIFTEDEMSVFAKNNLAAKDAAALKRSRRVGLPSKTGDAADEANGPGETLANGVG